MISDVIVCLYARRLSSQSVTLTVNNWLRSASASQPILFFVRLSGCAYLGIVCLFARVCHVHKSLSVRLPYLSGQAVTGSGHQFAFRVGQPVYSVGSVCPPCWVSPPSVSVSLSLPYRVVLCLRLSCLFCFLASLTTHQSVSPSVCRSQSQPSHHGGRAAGGGRWAAAWPELGLPGAHVRPHSSSWLASDQYRRSDGPATQYPAAQCTAAVNYRASSAPRHPAAGSFRQSYGSVYRTSRPVCPGRV